MSSSSPKPKIQTPKVHKVSWRQALWRGVRRRCPHCGQGPLFETWFGLHADCSVCHLEFERRPGDTWAFWLIGDRVFIAILLIVIVLGFRSSSVSHIFGLFGVVAVPLILTMPHRRGVCIGLDYLSRVYMGQPSEIPPSHDAST